MIDADTLTALANNAEAADREIAWPTASWELLRNAGVLGWSIPTEFGGSAKSPGEILRGSEQLAGACLTTAFALSQRETAVRRLLAGPRHLQEKYLPQLARGTTFLTVGLSQLTTSRQHMAPTLVAEAKGDRFELNGEIPWVTGTDAASAVVVGATLRDGLQILFVLPTNLKGVTIEPPMSLTALLGSRTSAIRCSNVEIERELLLAGPVESVLGKVGGGGLETSCLALGIAGAAIDSILDQAQNRPALLSLFERMNSIRDSIRIRLHELAVATPAPEQTLALRVECTRLALRATQANLLAAKGAGFVAPHSAARWARQALFFLVWSCPRPVVEGMLEEFIGS